jgi:hypothetical protein
MDNQESGTILVSRQVNRQLTDSCSSNDSLCPWTRRPPLASLQEQAKASRDFAPVNETTDVEIFLGQCRLLLLRAERGLPSSPANLRNVSRIANRLADSIEHVA